MAFLADSPTYLAGHWLHFILYTIPSFLQFVDFVFVLFLHTKQSSSGHLFGLNGSDVWRISLTCLPDFFYYLDIDIMFPYYSVA